MDTAEFLFVQYSYGPCFLADQWVPEWSVSPILELVWELPFGPRRLTIFVIKSNSRTRT